MMTDTVSAAEWRSYLMICSLAEISLCRLRRPPSRAL